MDRADVAQLSRLAVDIAEAQRFLDLMADGEAVTFQTFDDHADRKAPALVGIRHGYLNDHAPVLQALNAQGAGIYWMVNFGDGKGRSARSVTAVRALFLDLDGAPLLPVLDAGVEPHTVVESSPGKWHIYWLVTGCPLNEFKKWQQALAARYGGDSKVCDLPRVLRVPGFLHCKGEPFASRTVSMASRQPYPLHELIERLGLARAVAGPVVVPNKRGPARRQDGASEGGRNDFLSRKAYVLRKQGNAVDDIERALHELNAGDCAPPLSNDEVHAIAAGKAAVRPDGATLNDFRAHMPSHQYLFIPGRELWPAASVNGRVAWPEVDGKKIAPATWLDMHRPIEQTAWHPAEPELIRDRVFQVAGWVRHDGATVFNLYRAPDLPPGDATQAGPWIDHLAKVYPDDAGQITRWLAHRVQRPGDKCNHALVLGGAMGTGKDTMLEPLKAAVGPWNWSDINPSQMLARFNGWVKAVVVRVNEARDLGDVDRFAFYDHSKAIIAAPPDVLRVDEKHLRETYVANVCGVIITTNHLGDGLYLPADDRRHYVAWSPCTRDDFDGDYWNRLYGWFNDGGIGHVCAYLAGFDLSGFDPKAPPPKTAAFWSIVAAGDAPESGELRDVIEALDAPAALTLQHLIDGANAQRCFGLADELKDRKTRRTIPHKLERVGYAPVRNPDSDDGLFRVGGKRQAVYARRQLPLAEQVRAARRCA